MSLAFVLPGCRIGTESRFKSAKEKPDPMTNLFKEALPSSVRLSFLSADTNSTA
jgi:hypothetical protein